MSNALLTLISQLIEIRIFIPYFFFDKTARFIHYYHKNISYISLFEFYKPLVSCSTGRVLGTQPWTIVANSDIKYPNLEDLSVLATNKTPLKDQGLGHKM